MLLLYNNQTKPMPSILLTYMCLYYIKCNVYIPNGVSSKCSNLTLLVSIIYTYCNTKIYRVHVTQIMFVLRVLL